MGRIQTSQSARANESGWNGVRYVDAGLSGVVGFLGQPGVGKTYFAGRFLKSCRRVIVFNTVGAYGDGPRQNRLPGFVAVSQPGELIDILRARGFGSFRVLYTPRTNIEEHFDAVSRLILEVNDVVFAVDEIWNFQRPGWSPDTLKSIMLQGRIDGRTLVWTAQFAQSVDKKLTGVSTELYIGRLTQPGDLRVVSKRLPADALAAVPSLPNRRFLHVGMTSEWNIVRS